MDEHGWHFYDERDRVLPLPSSSVGGRLSLPHLQYSPYVGPHNPRSAPLPLPHHPYSSQQQQSPPPPPPPLPALPTGDQQQQSPGVVHSRSVNPAVQSTLWLRQEDQQRGSTLPPLDISSSRYDHNNSSRPMYQQQHASYSTAHPYPSHSNRRSNSGDYTPSPTSSIFPERGWPTASRASSASQLSPVENTVTVGELVSTLPVNFEHAEQVASTSVRVELPSSWMSRANTSFFDAQERTYISAIGSCRQNKTFYFYPLLYPVQSRSISRLHYLGVSSCFYRVHSPSIPLFFSYPFL